MSKLSDYLKEIDEVNLKYQLAIDYATYGNYKEIRVYDYTKLYTEWILNLQYRGNRAEVTIDILPKTQWVINSFSEQSKKIVTALIQYSISEQDKLSWGEILKQLDIIFPNR